MGMGEALRLSIDEARGVMLAAQSLLHPPAGQPGLDEVHALIERLGVLQIDTINVVERSQYLVLCSRLGPYDAAALDALLYPRRAVFEYWSHAASIVPMVDYPYYRRDMVHASTERMWSGVREWMEGSPEVIQATLATVRERGPMASADFERAPGAGRASPWDWYGPKESRRALEVLWTTGDLMIHSRRAGQKVYDVRERVLADVFGDAPPTDDDLPSADEYLRHFVRRTIRALGIVTPSWLLDYFRLRLPAGQSRGKRAATEALLEEQVRAGLALPAVVDGLHEPAYVACERLPDLQRLRDGDAADHTALLTPFDSLIWDRERARTLFGYEVCFEAYVVPEKRRYGYYSLAILHRGRLVGRLDPKMDRAARHLLVRAVYLEPGVRPSADLLNGLANALRDLADFLGAQAISVAYSEPEKLAPALAERLSGNRRRRRSIGRSAVGAAAPLAGPESAAAKRLAARPVRSRSSE